MGYERLMAWGLGPASPGTYIYESASGEDPIHRWGCSISSKPRTSATSRPRPRLFHAYGDAVSEHDMDFDWADETMHAGYGKHWLKELLAVRGQDPQPTIRCATAAKTGKQLCGNRHTGRSGRHQESGTHFDCPGTNKIRLSEETWIGTFGR